MKELGFDDYEIESKIVEVEDLSGWTPITFRELKSMTQGELDKLKSYCWHDGEPRCEAIGITNLKIVELEHKRLLEF